MGHGYEGVGLPGYDEWKTRSPDDEMPDVDYYMDRENLYEEGAKPMKYESVCFFLTSGGTFTFRDVEVVHDNEAEITIHYVAMSDGKIKAARFSKRHVAGIAYCEEQRTSQKVTP
jgi:hypothetical protein